MAEFLSQDEIDNLLDYAETVELTKEQLEERDLYKKQWIEGCMQEYNNVVEKNKIKNKEFSLQPTYSFIETLKQQNQDKNNMLNSVDNYFYLKTENKDDALKELEKLIKMIDKELKLFDLDINNFNV